MPLPPLLFLNKDVVIIDVVDEVDSLCIFPSVISKLKNRKKNSISYLFSLHLPTVSQSMVLCLGKQ